MTQPPLADPVAAARIAAGLLGVTALIAVAVHLAAAAPAREWLDFGFEGVPRTSAEIASIFMNNARVLGAVLIACVVAQATRTAPKSGPERFLFPFLGSVCDGVLLVGCALNVSLVGAGLGAYGGRTVEAVLPHGPLELAAFSLALALYLSARRERVRVACFATTAAVAVLALAVGAALEVYA